VTGPAGKRTNVELLREGFTAFSEGRLEDSLQTLHPDVEWHIAFRLPDIPAERSVIHGREQVLQLWRQFGSVWDRLVFDPQEILYDRDDRIVARTRIQATGGESGVELDSTRYYAMTLRDGLLARIRPFDSPAAAAADLGIDPAELS
jgi:ketosteroid isomerase-like protein